MAKECFDVVITGGSGRVGMLLATAALSQGKRVLVLDRVAPLQPRGVEVKILDLCHIANLRSISIKASSLVHLAAIPSPRLASPEEVFENNVLATFNALEGTRDWDISTIVLASSEAVYGFAFSAPQPPPGYLPIDEDYPLSATDPYGLSKIFSENLCEAHVRRGDCERAIALRFSWILEPNAQVNAVEQISTNVSRGLSKMFAYLDIRDAISVIVHSLTAKTNGFSPYIVAAPDTLSRSPTIPLANSHFPDSPWRSRPSTFGSLLQSSRIKEIGFTPSLSWREVNAVPT
jgi:nucleoside-diphosphate-sugar epimerase